MCTYIDHKASQLSPSGFRNDKALQGKVRDQMRQKSNGTFLWVALVIEELCRVLGVDMLGVLEDLPCCGIFAEGLNDNLSSKFCVLTSLIGLDASALP
jgi:hypothetical protein